MQLGAGRVATAQLAEGVHVPLLPHGAPSQSWSRWHLATASTLQPQQLPSCAETPLQPSTQLLSHAQ